MQKEDAVVELAYEKAKDTLKTCASRHGLYASGGPRGYKGVWSRDSMISLIGGSLVQKGPYAKIFRTQFKKSLITLGAAQSKKGQIPNAVHGWHHRKVHKDYLSIDSTLWWIIGNHIYKKRYKDSTLMRRFSKKLKQSVEWLEYQDMGENILLQQLPTTDWQDAFPHKYGHTISTQSLYFKALNLVGKKALARKLKKFVNNNNELELWNGKFYWAYRWKNHNNYKELGTWFDSFGNLLAIIFDLAGPTHARKILSCIKSKRIDKPFPVKAIWPPIRKGSGYWEDYYQDCNAGKIYNYLNGGIWPFIGSFYVLALVKYKKYKEAEAALKKLAESNIRSNLFPEWIHPVNKKSHGKLQAWDAGTYILAHDSLKKKRVLL